MGSGHGPGLYQPPTLTRRGRAPHSAPILRAGPGASRPEVSVAIDTAAPQAASGAGTTISAVTLENLEKTFGDVVAVGGIDLEIADGEFFSMLGPSGSGKTTTLRLIAGFELPTAGRVCSTART